MQIEDFKDFDNKATQLLAIILSTTIDGFKLFDNTALKQQEVIRDEFFRDEKDLLEVLSNEIISAEILIELLTLVTSEVLVHKFNEKTIIKFKFLNITYEIKIIQNKLKKVTFHNIDSRVDINLIYNDSKLLIQRSVQLQKFFEELMYEDTIFRDENNNVKYLQRNLFKNNSINPIQSKIIDLDKKEVTEFKSEITHQRENIIYQVEEEINTSLHFKTLEEVLAYLRLFIKEKKIFPYDKDIQEFLRTINEELSIRGIQESDYKFQLSDNLFNINVKKLRGDEGFLINTELGLKKEGNTFFISLDKNESGSYQINFEEIIDRLIALGIIDFNSKVNILDNVTAYLKQSILTHTPRFDYTVMISYNPKVELTISLPYMLKDSEDFPNNISILSTKDTKDTLSIAWNNVTSFSTKAIDKLPLVIINISNPSQFALPEIDAATLINKLRNFSQVNLSDTLENFEGLINQDNAYPLSKGNLNMNVFNDFVQNTLGYLAREDIHSQNIFILPRDILDSIGDLKTGGINLLTSNGWTTIDLSELEINTPEGLQDFSEQFNKANIMAQINYPSLLASLKIEFEIAKQNNPSITKLLFLPMTIPSYAKDANLRLARLSQDLNLPIACRVFYRGSNDGEDSSYLRWIIIEPLNGDSVNQVLEMTINVDSYNIYTDKPINVGLEFNSQLFEYTFLSLIEYLKSDISNGRNIFYNENFIDLFYKFSYLTQKEIAKFLESLNDEKKLQFESLKKLLLKWFNTVFLDISDRLYSYNFIKLLFEIDLENLLYETTNYYNSLKKDQLFKNNSNLTENFLILLNNNWDKVLKILDSNSILRELLLNMIEEMSLKGVRNAQEILIKTDRRTSKVENALDELLFNKDVQDYDEIRSFEILINHFISDEQFKIKCINFTNQLLKTSRYGDNFYIEIGDSVQEIKNEEGELTAIVRNEVYYEGDWHKIILEDGKYLYRSGTHELTAHFLIKSFIDNGVIEALNIILYFMQRNLNYVFVHTHLYSDYFSKIVEMLDDSKKMEIIDLFVDILNLKLQNFKFHYLLSQINLSALKGEEVSLEDYKKLLESISVAKKVYSVDNNDLSTPQDMDNFAECILILAKGMNSAIAQEVLRRYVFVLLEKNEGLITNKDFARFYLKYRLTFGGIYEIDNKINILKSVN